MHSRQFRDAAPDLTVVPAIKPGQSRPGSSAAAGRQARLWLVLLLTMAATLLPFQAAPASAARAQAPGTCADVLFIGARGTGEWGPGSPGWSLSTPSTTDPYGLGDRVNSAYAQFAGKVASRRSIDVHSVVYPADSLATLSGHPLVYFSDLTTGVDSALTELDQTRSRCPDQRIVLAGYSQGAMVMHRLVRELMAGAPYQRQILARVDAVILIADGDQVPYDTVTRFGSASLGARGISLAWRTLSRVQTSKLPREIGARVLSVCNSRDVVCDFTGWNVAGAGIHEGYTGAPETLAAADLAASYVLGVPLPTPRTVTLSATVGVPFSHQLTADVASDRTLQWRLDGPTAMPAGISLNAAGLVSGTPTVAGAVTTRVEVRASILGQPGPWIPVTITWVVAPPPTVPPTVRTYPVGDSTLLLRSGGVAADGTLFFVAEWTRSTATSSVTTYGIAGVNPVSGRIVKKWTLPWRGATTIDVPPIPNGTGGMWVATSQGLASFSASGRVTRVPTPGTSAATPGPAILGLNPLPDGSALVVPSQYAGPIWRVQPGGKMTRVPLPSGTSVSPYMSVDAAGTIWAGGSMTITLTGQVTRYPSPTWAGTCGGGLPVGVTDGRVVISYGGAIAGCGRGSIIDPVTHAFTETTTAPYWQSVTGPDARLWFKNNPGCDTSPYCGLARWDPRTDTIDVPVRDFVVIGDPVRAHDGSLWAATMGHDLSKGLTLMRISV